MVAIAISLLFKTFDYSYQIVRFFLLLLRYFLVRILVFGTYVVHVFFAPLIVPEAIDTYLADLLALASTEVLQYLVIGLYVLTETTNQVRRYYAVHYVRLWSPGYLAYYLLIIIVWTVLQVLPEDAFNNIRFAEYFQRLDVYLVLLYVGYMVIRYVLWLMSVYRSAMRERRQDPHAQERVQLSSDTQVASA